MPELKREMERGATVYAVYYQGSRKAFNWLSVAMLHMMVDLKCFTWKESR